MKSLCRVVNSAESLSIGLFFVIATASRAFVAVTEAD
jgi:hypothetical protein